MRDDDDDDETRCVWPIVRGGDIIATREPCNARCVCIPAVKGCDNERCKSRRRREFLDRENTIVADGSSAWRFMIIIIIIVIISPLTYIYIYKIPLFVLARNPVCTSARWSLPIMVFLTRNRKKKKERNTKLRREEILRDLSHFTTNGEELFVGNNYTLSAQTVTCVASLIAERLFESFMNNVFL